MHRHLKDELIAPDHVNPELSSGIAQVIEMMMAKSPTERYRSAGELIEDLDLIEQGESPRHARPVVDLSSVVTNLGDQTIPEMVEPTRIQRTPSGITGQPMSMTLIAILVISVIVNIILLATLASN